jgi:hypothetical protein
VYLTEEVVPVLKGVDMGKMIVVVVWIREVQSADESIVLPTDLKWIFEHLPHHAAIMSPNRQFPSGSVARPTFAVMIDPLDCCSCQSWRLLSNHQYHDSMHPDLQ